VADCSTRCFSPRRRACTRAPPSFSRRRGRVHRRRLASAGRMPPPAPAAPCWSADDLPLLDAIMARPWGRFAYDGAAVRGKSTRWRVFVSAPVFDVVPLIGTPAGGPAVL